MQTGKGKPCQSQKEGKNRRLAQKMQVINEKADGCIISLKALIQKFEKKSPGVFIYGKGKCCQFFIDGRSGKKPAKTLPEGRSAAAVNTLAADEDPVFFRLFQKSGDSSSFSIAHRGSHSGNRILENVTERLLEAL